jgi:uncharacterized protein YbjT (DUF2867 family)
VGTGDPCRARRRADGVPVRQAICGRDAPRDAPACAHGLAAAGLAGSIDLFGESVADPLQADPRTYERGETEMRPDVKRRVLVTGGTGHLGRELIPRCREHGWTVRIMSRRPAPAVVYRLEWATADLATGAGLDAAVEGVDAIAHLASLPYRGRGTDRVDVEGTARLLSAAGRAGVSHVVYSSIVGVDAIPWPYFRKKLAAEHHMRDGSVPWSIVRATQFFPLVDRFLEAAARLPVLLGPTDVPGRPVDPRDVAERIARQIARGPSARVEDYAGPETLSFGELAGQWLAARGRRKRVVHLPIPGRLGRAFRSGAAVPVDAESGARTWRSWLEERTG